MPTYKNVTNYLISVGKYAVSPGAVLSSYQSFSVDGLVLVDENPIYMPIDSTTVTVVSGNVWTHSFDSSIVQKIKFKNVSGSVLKVYISNINGTYFTLRAGSSEIVTVDGYFNTVILESASSTIVDITWINQQDPSMSVTIPESFSVSSNVEGNISISPNTSVITVSITRPSNTNHYDIGNFISSSISDSDTDYSFGFKIPGCAKAAGGSGNIIKAMLYDSCDSTNGRGSFRLQLYTSQLSAGFADNSFFETPAADYEKIVDIINFDKSNGAIVGTGNGVFIKPSNADYPITFVCDSDKDYLYGVLTALTSYSPSVGGETFTLKLYIQQ